MTSSDLSFIPDEKHRSLLAQCLAELSRDESVVGVLLMGSLARGYSHPGSDIDLFCLLKDGESRRWIVHEKEGIRIEQRMMDEPTAKAKLDDASDPMEPYQYTDGHLLDDPTGRLASLVLLAQQKLDAYRVADRDREAIVHWLTSTQVKLRGALQAGEEVKIGHLVATNTWEMITGLFAANDLPPPPQGSVLWMLPRLSRVPPDFEARFRRMFSAEAPKGRAEAMMTIVDWIVAELGGHPT